SRLATLGILRALLARYGRSRRAEGRHLDPAARSNAAAAEPDPTGFSTIAAERSSTWRIMMLTTRQVLRLSSRCPSREPAGPLFAAAVAVTAFAFGSRLSAARCVVGAFGNSKNELSNCG